MLEWITWLLPIGGWFPGSFVGLVLFLCFMVLGSCLVFLFGCVLKCCYCYWFRFVLFAFCGLCVGNLVCCLVLMRLTLCVGGWFLFGCVLLFV